MAHDHLSEGLGGEKSTRRLAKSNSCANMEEEGQQERLQFLQRHITTQPSGVALTRKNCVFYAKKSRLRKSENAVRLL